MTTARAILTHGGYAVTDGTYPSFRRFTPSDNPSPDFVGRIEIKGNTAAAVYGPDCVEVVCNPATSLYRMECRACGTVGAWLLRDSALYSAGIHRRRVHPTEDEDTARAEAHRLWGPK